AVHCIGVALAARGEARIALAGGGTPRPLHRRLAESPWVDAVDWSGVHVFWGDERCVPPDDPASNYRMARETLLDHIPLDPSAIHRIAGELPAKEAAAAYAEQLGDAPLDLVLLGLGGDGHTASIFPDTPIRAASDQAVLVTRSPVAPAGRVTLGLGPINGARTVAFLALGPGKARTVARVLAEFGTETPALPAARVHPASGELHWFLDGESAAELGDVRRELEGR
ncbi:MAG: 6-phosphogluconolactonase, partial [Myxococcota bacterium]|nr:6-phosphogluconolactonase [Myxococcota bacterium]